MIEKSPINIQLGIKFNSYIDEKPNVWFKAKEVAQILGYKDTDQSIRKHVDKEDKYKGAVETTGGLQTCVFISESGLYSLVLSSKLETAKKFKRWITTDVLPSIRKFGYYKMIDSRIKQRVIIDGVKYYKHHVFTNYAASKNGKVINVKTGRIIRMSKNGNGYLKFNLSDKKNLKNLIHILIIDLYTRFFKGSIPKCLEVDHINEIKTDNRIKNLQLLNHKQNSEKSNNKAIISICIETGKERKYISIKKAAIELDIDAGNIPKVCRKKYKFLTSKKDGKKYSFNYLD